MVSGQRHGPIEVDVLQQWIGEGRVSLTDLVWREGMDQWQAINAVQELGHAPSALELLAAATGDGPPPTPGTTPTKRKRYRPHRGTTILVLGILSWVLCFILGIIAWSMGNSDLREIKAGRMDPAGQGSTEAGRILGMIHVILCIVVFAVYAVILLVAAAS